jgi:aminopeptidase N
MFILPGLNPYYYQRRCGCIKMEKNDCSLSKSNKFEFPGSIPHYPRPLFFSIDYMWLHIKPDFASNTLKDCLQKLRIRAYKDINQIELDIAEIDIHQVMSSGDDNVDVMHYNILNKDDRLIIKLRRTLYKDKIMDLIIRYSAGYYNLNGALGIHKPRSGFHFVSSDGLSNQAWTHGQALESKYWFPCLEDPQVKFPREIQVIVPDNDYIVISNGELAQKDENMWTWIEQNPIPAYLTSVVIGNKFAHAQQMYTTNITDSNNDKKKYNTIPLSYYWPEEIPKKDAMLTFDYTPNVIRFFEEYFGMRYPYKKYTQVAVDEFELGGMENTNCTTLAKSLLHDEIAAFDYTRDIEIVVHELAHQWLGDLVTCKDWSNIWLNEGPGTYFEALYWENVKGFDDFCYKVIKIANEYFEESRHRYERPLVTITYKHPDELFDAHSYQKGACVLHMLRYYIGDSHFKESLKNYLNIFRNRNADSDDLRKIIEHVSNKSLSQFFDQWVYRSGHPNLDITLSLEKEDPQRIRIKIAQKQGQYYGNDGNNIFIFDLDIKLVFSSTIDRNMEILETVHITKELSDYSFKIPLFAKIEWISIDPQFKILAEIESIKVENETTEFQLKELLKNQLRQGKTVIERIQAARVLRHHYSEDVVNELQSVILADPFYGVSVEAANTLGSFHERDNYNKSYKAYQALVSCINKKGEIFSTLHPEIKQAIVQNIGKFERNESINLLEPILYKQHESYFVRAKAATAIGKSIKEDGILFSSHHADKEKKISQLKDIVKTSNSFRNVIASGAIDGLKELSDDKNKEIVVDIANFLLENTDLHNEYFKRLAAISALSKFVFIGKDNHNGKNAVLLNMNRKVFNTLLELLKDRRRKVKIDACKALANPDAKPSLPDIKVFETIEALIHVAEHDLDGFVRTEAERSANIVREWIKEWSSKPLTIELNIREGQ